MPDVVQLVDEAVQSNAPLQLRRGDEVVALLLPLARGPRRRGRTTLVRMGHPPSIHYRTLDELIADREPPPAHPFTWGEIEATLMRDRADRWREKAR